MMQREGTHRSRETLCTHLNYSNSLRGNSVLTCLLIWAEKTHRKQVKNVVEVREPVGPGYS